MAAGVKKWNFWPNLQGFISKWGKAKSKSYLVKKHSIWYKLGPVSCGALKIQLKASLVYKQLVCIYFFNPISRGDFVVEYAGELIEHSTAEERENKYAMDISKGCYMYYFKTNGKHYW